MNVKNVRVSVKNVRSVSWSKVSIFSGDFSRVIQQKGNRLSKWLTRLTADPGDRQQTHNKSIAKA
jgi:hypothetical protein